jgi:Holliday junction resolvase
MGSWRYFKGAFYERELLKKIGEKGFFVTRAAGSGVDGLSPDLIALSTTKKFAVECKAWKNPVRIEKAKMRVMEEWQQRTGLPVYVAWKRPREDWRFFPLSALRETGKGFVLLGKDADIGMELDDLVK